MPKLPEKITLNLDTEKLFIDGVEFPWYIVEDSIDVAGLMTNKAIPAVTLSIFADTIEVIPQRRTLTYKCLVRDGEDPEETFDAKYPDVERINAPRLVQKDGGLWICCDVLAESIPKKPTTK